MKINILNKPRMLTLEDRKERLEHGCNYFVFETCLDLSEPVKVKAYHGTKFTVEQYSADVAAFICWWTLMVMKDLNGFSGFSHVKFEPQNFKIV